MRLDRAGAVGDPRGMGNKPLLIGSLALALCLAGAAGCKDPEKPRAQQPAATGGNDHADPVLRQQLEERFEELIEAVKARRGGRALELARQNRLHDPDAWFARAFGPDLGARLALDFRSQSERQEKLPGVIASLVAQGRDMVVVRPIDAETTPDLVAAREQMVHPVDLYVVELRAPASEKGVRVGTYARERDQLVYVGNLRLALK